MTTDPALLARFDAGILSSMSFAWFAQQQSDVSVLAPRRWHGHAGGDRWPELGQADRL